MVSNDVYIHPTAIIDNRAQIGARTRIWVNAQIREFAQVGVDCIISKDVYIDLKVIIGDRCKIQNGVSIYRGVIIENDVFVGPSVTFTNDRVPRAFNQDWEITPTVVKSGASIGAGSTIVCGVTVGCYSMIAAGSVVTKNVEPYTLVRGNPATFHSVIDKAGRKVLDF
jgi:UDP-2-acetamido-3-amino-2,3-dideoxy-glucuronate N-acetyltransferase